MTVIGPVTGIYDPTHPAFSYTDHSGVAVTSVRARFLRPLVFNNAYEHCAPGSRIRFRSNAPSLQINLFFNNLQDTAAYSDAFCVIVDGISQAVDPVNNRTAYAYGIPLSFGSVRLRTIEVILPYGAGVDFTNVTQDPIYLLVPCLNRPSTKLLAIGDSITHGFDATFVQNSWPFLLASNKNYELVNMGYGSSRTENHMAGDDSGNIDPDIITILLGHNDFGAQIAINTFKTQYTTLLNNLLSDTTAKIYAITLLWTSLSNTITPAQYRTAIGEAVATIGNPRIVVLDGLPLATNSTAHFPDGIHPNDAGSAAIASSLTPLVAP